MDGRCRLGVAPDGWLASWSLQHCLSMYVRAVLSQGKVRSCGVWVPSAWVVVEMWLHTWGQDDLKEDAFC